MALCVRFDTRKIAYKIEEVDDKKLDPFQERMIKWVLKQRRKRAGIENVPTVEEEQQFRNDLETIKEYEGDIDAFITQKCITHYISAIHLGASIYKVYTEEEYDAAAKAGFHIKVPLAGNFWHSYLVHSYLDANCI